ncbi:phosphotransferase [Umezawaea sp. NPDC059074]|uniref:phosphotransferase n=1 Tax=Umezawaea sp. NPDC059074 TaxID=3346716 RepID=UPI0036B8844F
MVVKVGVRERVVGEVAALGVAGAGGVAVPRVVGVGEVGGVFVVVNTVVVGSSRIPRGVDVGRLRQLGSVAARLGQIEVEVSEELPLRVRSIEDVDFAVERRGVAVWEAAEEVVAGVGAPGGLVGLVGLVHGDLWQGNTMWSGGVLSGLVDWDAAGVGSSGIDLASLRIDAAILYGDGAADVVLEGWEREAGSAAEDVAYWDLVAALSTPPDMGGWASTIQEQGREDLAAEVMTERRDAFLRAALAEWR